MRSLLSFGNDLTMKNIGQLAFSTDAVHFVISQSNIHTLKTKNFRMISAYQKCFVSGVLACIGSLFAKWAFGDASVDDIYHFQLSPVLPMVDFWVRRFF